MSVESIEERYCRFIPDLTFAVLNFTFAFAIPLIMMLVAYLKIFCVVQSQIKRIKPRMSDMWEDGYESEVSTFHFNSRWGIENTVTDEPTTLPVPPLHQDHYEAIRTVARKYNKKRGFCINTSIIESVAATSVESSTEQGSPSTAHREVTSDSESAAVPIPATAEKGTQVSPGTANSSTSTAAMSCSNCGLTNQNIPSSVDSDTPPENTSEFQGQHLTLTQSPPVHPGQPVLCDKCKCLVTKPGCNNEITNSQSPGDCPDLQETDNRCGIIIKVVPPSSPAKIIETDLEPHSNSDCHLMEVPHPSCSHILHRTSDNRLRPSVDVRDDCYPHRQMPKLDPLRKPHDHPQVPASRPESEADSGIVLLPVANPKRVAELTGYPLHHVSSAPDLLSELHVPCKQRQRSLDLGRVMPAIQYKKSNSDEYINVQGTSPPSTINRLPPALKKRPKFEALGGTSQKRNSVGFMYQEELINKTNTTHHNMRSDGTDEDTTGSSAATTETSAGSSVQHKYPRRVSWDCRSEEPPSQRHTRLWAITHFNVRNENFHNQKTGSVNSDWTNSTKRSTRSSLRKRLRENKAVRMTAAVIGAFAIAWMPYQILQLYRLVCHFECISSTWFSVSVLFMCMSSAVNPFIYNFYSHEFRMATKKLLTCSTNQVNPHIPN